MQSTFVQTPLSTKRGGRPFQGSNIPCRDLVPLLKSKSTEVTLELDYNMMKIQTDLPFCDIIGNTAFSGSATSLGMQSESTLSAFF